MGEIHWSHQDEFVLGSLGDDETLDVGNHAIGDNYRMEMTLVNLLAVQLGLFLVLTVDFPSQVNVRLVQPLSEL